MENCAISLNVPSREYIEMIYVKPTPAMRGHNEKIIMENNGDGTFTKTEGRVGITVGRYKPVRIIRPITEWDSMYQSKLQKGYKVISTKKLGTITQNKAEYKEIEDEGVRAIVQELREYTENAMAENYIIKADAISPEMIKEGKEILDELADHYEHMSVAQFNNRLTDLFRTIPRRMDVLSRHLAMGNQDFRDILSAEQELFDNMVLLSSKEGIAVAEKTILEANNITWRRVTEEEKSEILKKLGVNARLYEDAWAIDNRMTSNRFNAYCQKENLSKGNGVSTLFHGSRSENFWRIITQGLTINPKGVVITGKAYGNGTYFAPDSAKSLGYTSRNGSKWAGGHAKYGFLGVYDVATGKRYNGSLGCDTGLNWNKLQQICPGAHCTWAEVKYSGFCMDEVIVYQDAQSTIKYLVKMGF